MITHNTPCKYRFNISVYFNTFVSSEYVNLDKFMTVQRKNVWFVNNVFVARSDAAVFDGTSGGINFLGNTYTSTDGTLGASFVADHDLEETEMLEADPLMERNTDGSYYVPSANSPAIGNAVSWPESTDTINVFDVPNIGTTYILAYHHPSQHTLSRHTHPHNTPSRTHVLILFPMDWI